MIGASPLKPGQAAELGAALGMGWVMAPTRHLRTALFGNVVLSKFPVRHHVQHDLTWKTCEHRGVQRVDLALDDDTLHFYNVHLGTSLLERRSQAAKLASLVHDRRVVGPKIVLGDFNEWARGIAKDILAERLQSIDLSKHLKRGGRSYPGFFPILHLDHIYYEGTGGSDEGVDAARSHGADGVRSSAARRRPEDRLRLAPPELLSASGSHFSLPR